jgi:hypothetical protein
MSKVVLAAALLTSLSVRNERCSREDADTRGASSAAAAPKRVRAAVRNATAAEAATMEKEMKAAAEEKEAEVEWARQLEEGGNRASNLTRRALPASSAGAGAGSEAMTGAAKGTTLITLEIPFRLRPRLRLPVSSPSYPRACRRRRRAQFLGQFMRGRAAMTTASPSISSTRCAEASKARRR